MPLDQQIELLLNVILLLIGAVFLLCAYIAAAPPWTWTGWGKSAPEPICPIHKVPRNTCGRYHKDEE